MLTRDAVFSQFSSYYPQADRTLFDRACALAEHAHRLQKTPDGRDYLQHSLEVAAILARLKVDQTTILVGILHDLLDTPDASRSEIEKHFGTEVFQLIEAGQKISSIPYRQKNRQQVESFRKMFVAMARDLRVVLVYLSDRLSDMRAISHCAQARKEAYSRETLEVYAPLA
ncbi:MAG: HD domain-containing protein, partial [Pelovirga sp.]